MVTLGRLWPLLLMLLLTNLVHAQSPDRRSGSPRPKIVFNCAALSEQSPLYAKVSRLYTTAFDHLGYDFEMRSAVTLRRSIMENLRGGVDGDCGRVDNFTNLVPNSGMLRVDVKLVELELAAWSYNDKIRVTSPDEIGSKGYVVGYPRGAVAVEKFLADHHITKTVAFNSPESGLKMLTSQRFDLLLHSSGIVTDEARMLGVLEKIYRVGVFDHYRIYPHLNQKNAFLKTGLEAELRKQLPSKGLTLEE